MQNAIPPAADSAPADNITGYILDTFSTDTRTAAGSINILTLCCLGAEGYFEVEIPNHRLVFFVERGIRLPELRGMERKPVGLTDFAGRELDGLYFSSQSAYYAAARKLRETGVRVLESDVHPDDRFLMEHFIFRGISFPADAVQAGIAGPGRPAKEAGQPEIPLYRPGKIEPADFTPDFRILSFDIETGQDGRLYCSGFHLSGRGGDDRVVFMLDTGKASGGVPEEVPSGAQDAVGEGAPDGVSGGLVYRYIPVSTEKELVEATLAYIRSSDPDIIIGWHVIGFDLTFIENKCRQFNLPFGIGRRGQNGKIIRKRSGLYAVEAFGRIVIDGPVSLRGGFYTFGDYRLETVALAVLGVGKAISGHVEAEVKIAEIEERFALDKKALAYYNLMDCILVSRIYEETGLTAQLVTRSRLTGLRMDKVNQSVAAFDFYMLPKVHRHGYAAPNVADVQPGRHAAGGLVFTSDPGLYKNIMILDFLSLYPSIIRTFMIDPLARLTAERYPDTPSYDTPAGIRFSSDTNILPERIGELMESRARAKKEKDAPLSQSIKILMNSFYGVMGTTGCRFYHPDLPTAITGTGQWILKATAEFIREKGLRVIYGDTDSVFVEISGPVDKDHHPDGRDEESSAVLMKRGDALAAEINQYFTHKLKEEFGVDSKLVLEVEKLYLRFFLPPMRGSSEGSRKRYAGLIADDEKGLPRQDTDSSGEYTEKDIELKGLEYVRSDWTDIAKEFQMELFRRYFLDEEIPEWIKKTVDSIRKGEADDKLVYKRRLTKPAVEYVKNVPPHVKAARLLDPDGKRGIRRVEYVMTLRGPIPLAHKHDDIDYKHYIEKQIEPLADTVLPYIGTTFTALVDGRQGELF